MRKGGRTIIPLEFLFMRLETGAFSSCVSHHMNKTSLRIKSTPMEAIKGTEKSRALRRSSHTLDPAVPEVALSSTVTFSQPDIFHSLLTLVVHLRMLI